MRILYVEDNLMLGSAIQIVLQSKGHAVHWIQDRKETPGVLDFDLVISDYEVPGGTFSSLKDYCDTRHIPLILMSGSRFETVPHKNFLSKPTSMSGLLDMIKQVTGRAM